MRKIEYLSGDASILDLIRSLWQELNDHHTKVSLHFSNAFATTTFEARKESLIANAIREGLLVDIAIDSETGREIGYCISCLRTERWGTIESLYVKPEFRNTGIGQTLMERALNWLETKKVVEKTIAVVYGNEQTFAFYARFGFHPRITTLKQK